MAAALYEMRSGLEADLGKIFGPNANHPRSGSIRKITPVRDCSDYKRLAFDRYLQLKFAATNVQDIDTQSMVVGQGTIGMLDRMAWFIPCLVCGWPA